MKLSSIYICQLFIGLACSEFAISDWIKKFKNQNNAHTFRQPTMETTTELPCTPHVPKCTTLFVSAIVPRMVMDYADIKGRYIHNPDASVEWAPDRPIYEKVSQSRNSMHER